MQIHQLRYFCAVSKTLSFTRAAQDLSIAQPSLSQQIRRLEREVGFRLFDRSPRLVRMTREGNEFLSYARAVLDRLADAESAASAIRGSEQGHVVLGVSPFAGAAVLPGLLTAVLKHYPKLKVTIEEAGLGRLTEMLLSGLVDLAMVLLPTDHPELRTTRVLADNLLVVLPAGHHLSGHRRIDIGLLRDEPLVLLSPEFGLRQQVDSLCRANGFKPSVTFESGQVTILQGMAEAGIGATVLPESAVRQDLATVARPLLVGGIQPQRYVGLAVRTDRYVSVAARAVFELARGLDPISPSG